MSLDLPSIDTAPADDTDTSTLAPTVDPRQDGRRVHLRRRDSGLTCVALIGTYYRKPVEPLWLRHELGLGGRRATGDDLVRAAILAGFSARRLPREQPDRLTRLPKPAIIGLADGSYTILGKGPDGLTLLDHATYDARATTLEEIQRLWSGEIIQISQNKETGSGDESFGIGWFMAALARNRSPFIEVLALSFFVQIFALITPLLFQVVIDRVLVHNAVSTLNIVVTALVVFGFFEAALTYLRNYILSHTSSRVDAELGAKLYDKLFQLPMIYFEKRPTGQTITRFRELENIRQFLTGQGLLSIVDLCFSLVFFAVLFMYSVKLSLVVAFMIPCFVLFISSVRPVLRERIKAKFYRSAESQQFLVETVSSASTVKAAAVEPLIRQQWEERLARYLKTAFRAGTLSSFGQSGLQFLNKLSTVSILYFGAHEVMSGHLSVGGLIAFNMIAAQMQSPILKLASLWQDFQQVQISVERIGDILNTPSEPKPAFRVALPQIQGAISFSSVTFQYNLDQRPVLRDVNFRVSPGEMIGIVGPSGSGKSTITKLLQRFYSPSSGSVFVDGFDVAHVDPAWLRRQIGVVLQENLLFNRTVHENIALTTPGASRERVVAMARLAGADEFIRLLPYGYDTVIEERGANLSGGQRQRLAIARALMREPKILILDEATSALDYESEKIIQDNMAEIASGKTVLIIAHRLAAVRRCNRILSVVNGQIVEEGSHDELVNKPGGTYAHLWRLQSQSGE